MVQALAWIIVVAMACVSQAIAVVMKVGSGGRVTWIAPRGPIIKNALAMEVVKTISVFALRAGRVGYVRRSSVQRPVLHFQMAVGFSIIVVAMGSVVLMAPVFVHQALQVSYV